MLLTVLSIPLEDNKFESWQASFSHISNSLKTINPIKEFIEKSPHKVGREVDGDN